MVAHVQYFRMDWLNPMETCGMHWNMFVGDLRPKTWDLSFREALGPNGKLRANRHGSTMEKPTGGQQVITNKKEQTWVLNGLKLVLNCFKPTGEQIYITLFNQQLVGKLVHCRRLPELGPFPATSELQPIGSCVWTKMFLLYLEILSLVTSTTVTC